MTTPRTICLCLLTAFAGAGCGSAEGRSAEAVRDSAGVRIVESRAAGSGAVPAWRVDEQPAMAIGVAEGAPEYQLAGVRGAIRLASGGVVIANGHSKEVRYYDARGRFVRAVGKEGGGPGEFTSLDAVVPYRGDSVAVWDVGAWRLTVFGPDGGFGRTATVQGVTSLVGRLKGAFPDGSFVLAAAGSVEDYLRTDTGERRDSVAYLRFSADGAFADTLARHAAQEHVALQSPGRILIRPILFGRDSYVGVGTGQVFVGQSDAFRIDGVDPRGMPVLSIRRLGELRTPSRDEVARARAASEAVGQTQARAAGAGAPRGEVLPARPTIPAFDRILVDPQGNLWVREFLLSPEDAQRWSVFDPQGRLAGTARTPAGVEVYQVGADWILGRGLDDLDVEYVRTYRLRREAAPADD
jgi:hypothetical protein